MEGNKAWIGLIQAQLAASVSAALIDVCEVLRETGQDIHRMGFSVTICIQRWIARFGLMKRSKKRSNHTAPPSPRYEFRSPRAGANAVEPQESRIPPGSCRQFVLCLLRAVNEQWESELYCPFVLSAIVLHFALGAGLASIWGATLGDLGVLGRPPSVVCAQQLFSLYPDCVGRTFVGTYNIAIMTWSVIPLTVGGASAVPTFAGPAMSVYYREASSGLLTPPYGEPYQLISNTYSRVL